MSKNSRLKTIAASILKHTYSNIATYVTMIGAVSEENYPVALVCLKVIVLREVVGAVKRRIDKSKEKDDQTKP